MCPACMASAALTAGGVITTGGLTALVGKIFYTAKSAKTDGLEQSPVVSLRSPAKPRPSTRQSRRLQEPVGDKYNY